MNECPTPEILRTIGSDSIGEDTFEGLDAHLEYCPKCIAFLDAEHKNRQAALDAPTRSPSVPGLLLDRELGRGGSGVVYLARETTPDRLVAAKFLLRNVRLDPGARAHWLREANTLAKVSHHDHVVAIHGLKETEDWLCLILEYMPGGTLKGRLSGPIPPRDAARLAESIARGVGHLHSRRVIHLDLKPSNILLTGEPGAPWHAVSPRISDFGIARIEGEPGLSRTGSTGPIGTPSYMAPEQVTGRHDALTPSADLHALGVILYQLLTGRVPYLGETDAETLDQVRHQVPVPPRRLNRKIPIDLETITLKCLGKKPGERYATAEELADDLGRFLKDEPIRARRVTWAGHAWRWARRHPAIAGLLALLAMTVTSGVIGLFVLLGRVEDERQRLAEARRRAEAYEQFTASVTEQLNNFLTKTLAYAKNISDEERLAILRSLRDSAVELQGRGIFPSTTLATLKARISWQLWQDGRLDEALDLYGQAGADFRRCLEINPEDSEARLGLGKALCFPGMIRDKLGQADEALDHFEQAADYVLTPEPGLYKGSLIFGYYSSLQTSADRFRRAGRADQEARARQLGRRILRFLMGQGITDPSPRLDALRPLFGNEEFRAQAARDGTLAKWLALAVEPFSPFQSPSRAEEFDRDPEASATALVGAVRDLCAELGLEGSLVPAALSAYRFPAMDESSEHRQAGRLDEACATSARLMAIARQVARDYPNDAGSFQLLSDAYNHVKKNAMKTGDNALVEECLVQAIEAAQRAYSLDPNQFELGNQLEKLIEQLAWFRAVRDAKAASTGP